MPRELILDEDAADESAVAALWGGSEREVALPAHVRLALLILHELRLGEQSAAAPYLRMLPSPEDFAADGGPASTWSDDELGATGAVCYDFQKGKCTRGDKCKFEHTIVDTVKADSGKSPQKDKGDKGGKGSAPRSVFGDEYAPGAVQAARVGLVTCECEAALGAHAEAVV